MKTKFKDILLYSLACIGAISLFLSAYQPQETTSTVPESHVWELHKASRSASVQRVYALNKVTGEVRKYSSADMRKGKNVDQYYQVMTENLAE